MKLKLGGRFTSMEALPTCELPKNAVRFVEPEGPEAMNRAVLRLSLLILLVLGVVIGLNFALRDAIWEEPFTMLLAVGASLMIVVPHELLHAICFGKDAEVFVYHSLKHGMAFVLSHEPVSKGRFVFLSLLPNVVFGLLPFLAWIIWPAVPFWSVFLLLFSVMTITMGVGDYMNVINALRQMPKGSMQILSGFHSYWYMP